MTLFDTLKFLIDRGRTDGLEDKINKLHNANKLSDEEYENLISMLNPTEV